MHVPACRKPFVQVASVAQEEFELMARAQLRFSLGSDEASMSAVVPSATWAAHVRSGEAGQHRKGPVGPWCHVLPCVVQLLDFVEFPGNQGSHEFTSL